MTNSSASRRERGSSVFSRRRILCAAIAMLMLAVPDRSAVAQEIVAPVVLVIDMQRVQRDSAAAESIRGQSAALRAKLEEAVAARAREISDEEAELATLRERITPEEFAERVDGFKKKVFANREFAQRETGKLQTALADASNRLRNQIAPILAKIMRERKAQVMLDSNQVVLSIGGLDITDEVIERLNIAVPTMKLVLEKPVE